MGITAALGLGGEVARQGATRDLGCSEATAAALTLVEVVVRAPGADRLRHTVEALVATAKAEAAGSEVAALHWGQQLS